MQLFCDHVHLVWEGNEEVDDGADVSAQEDEEDDHERPQHTAVLARGAAAAEEREESQEAENDDEDLKTFEILDRVFRTLA